MIAVLYQAAPAPSRNGIIKPMKPGGYADSGADIAYSLQRQGVESILPTSDPDIDLDMDWVFADTESGIEMAIARGATALWLNTVLYKGHAVERYMAGGISVIGQYPARVEDFDDKLFTNRLLSQNGLPIPRSVTVTKGAQLQFPVNFTFPVVAKPIRGRGSQGVSLVASEPELRELASTMFASNEFGDAIYVEEFLPGQELTITVMPPGVYLIGGEMVCRSSHWALPAVRRFNHANGIAPYNGTVAVMENSEVLSDRALANPAVQKLHHDCERAAALVGAKAPIRIDCRAGANGRYFLFDLNMKPNMTGPSRPHRQGQDSLTALAARKIGWDFDLLIYNMSMQSWTI